MAYIQTGVKSKDLQKCLTNFLEAMEDLNEIWSTIGDDDILNVILSKQYPFEKHFEATLVESRFWIEDCIERINRTEEREFIVKDNSGRGGVNTVTESFARKHFENFVTINDGDNEDDAEGLYQWLQNSEIGDVFSYDNATVFTRSK